MSAPVLPLQPGSVRLMLVRDVDTGALVDAEVFFSAAEADAARAALLLGLDRGWLAVSGWITWTRRWPRRAGG